MGFFCQNFLLLGYFHILIVFVLGLMTGRVRSGERRQFSTVTPIYITVQIFMTCALSSRTAWETARPAVHGQIVAEHRPNGPLCVTSVRFILRLALYRRTVQYNSVHVRDPVHAPVFSPLCTRSTGEPEWRRPPTMHWQLGSPYGALSGKVAGEAVGMEGEGGV